MENFDGQRVPSEPSTVRTTEQNSFRSLKPDNKIRNALKCFALGIIEDNENGCLKWKFAEDGQYTVKLGYHHAFNWIQSKSASVGESSAGAANKIMWSKLWTLPMPERYKIFAWRIYYNALPDYRNLASRRCKTSEGCTFCGYSDENNTHLFIDCWWAQAFWRNLGIQPLKPNFEGVMREWFWSTLTGGNRTEALKLCVGLWVLWWNRNLGTHNKPILTVEQSSTRVLMLIAQAERKGIPGLAITNGIPQSLPQCIIKCDGSWNKQEGMGSCATIAFKDGIVIGCLAQLLPSCGSALHAEIAGIGLGITLATKLKEAQIRIQTDNINAIWAIQGCGGGPRDTQDHLIQVNEELYNHPHWSINHIPREENKAADELAAVARRHKRNWNRLDAIPIYISSTREQIV